LFEAVSPQEIGAGIAYMPDDQIASQCAGDSQRRSHTLQRVIAVGFFSQSVVDLKKALRHSFQNSRHVLLALKRQGPV
jgi:hypothetical protein